MEEILIRQIEGGIRGIRMGTKTPQTADLNSKLEKLKKLNEPMYDELNQKYIEVVKETKTK